MTFKIKGISISVSVYFAATVTFALLFFQGRSILPTLICCILHEVGHLIMIRVCRGNVRKISLGAYGMRIDPVRTLKISPKKEILISLAGPFVNIILSIFGLIAKQNLLLRINLVLCFFNLIPAGKTDGHTAIYNALILKLNRAKSESVMKIISTAFLIIMYLMGITALIKTKSNFSVLAAAIYITIINAVKN